MEVNKRRLYDDDSQIGYEEGDQDYFNNNRELAVWLLDNFNDIKRALYDAESMYTRNEYVAGAHNRLAALLIDIEDK